ncbi:MAG: hypothetical protein ACK45V_08570 [Brevundimonas sp.]
MLRLAIRSLPRKPRAIGIRGDTSLKEKSFNPDNRVEPLAAAAFSAGRASTLSAHPAGWPAACFATGSSLEVRRDALENQKVR